MRIRQTQIPENIEILASNIKDIIKKKGLKITEVAELAKIDIETFRRYLGAEGKPPLVIMGADKLIKIAHALKLEDFNELFLGMKSYNKK